MCDVVLDGLLVATEELFGVVSDPGMKRRLRFGEMVVKRVMKQMLVTRKNTITKIVQIHNGFNGLMGELALLEIVVGTVALIVAKFPNGMHRVDEGLKGVKNTKFVNHFRIEVVNEEVIL